MKLQNLFIPDVFQSYYVLKNRCVGIHATASHIYISIIEAHRYARTLVSSTTYPLETLEDGQENKFVTTLKKIKTELGNYDNLTITIPGSSVVFKELTLPFVSREKIALVLPLEIEPYLPFASTDAVIDFMITSVNTAEKKSTIMVTAAPKTVLTEILDPYLQAGLYPNQVAVDMLALFSFADHFAVHHTHMAIVAFDERGVSLAYCPETSLKAVRTISAHHHEHDTLKAIAFTLHGFQDAYGPVEHIIVTGTKNQEHLEHLKKELGASVVSLRTEKTDHKNAKITFEHGTEHHEAFSLAAAMPTQENTDFNIIPLEIQQQQLGKTFSKQIIAAGFLSILLLGGLTAHTVLNIRKLSRAAQTVKADTLKELKKRFPNLKTTNISTALKTAQKDVAAQQELWSAFSGSTSNYLQYLATLSSAIDRDSLGLTLTKMAMNKKTITLEGKVQSFEALEALEKRLKESNLFVQIPDLQKTDFSLVLTIKPQGDAA